MPKVYKSRLKPVIRTVTSTSGKVFKRVYYEKDAATATNDSKVLKPKSSKTSSENSSSTKKNIVELFDAVRKGNMVSLGNSYVLVASKHEKGSIFNPNDNDVHSIQMGAASRQKDFDGLMLYGVKKSNDGKYTEIVYRKGKESFVYRASADIHNNVQNELLDNALSKVHSLMKEHDISLNDVASELSKKYKVPESIMQGTLSSLMDGKGKGGFSGDTAKHVMQSTGLKFVKKVESALHAISKHFNEKSNVFKALKKNTSRGDASKSPRKVILRITRHNVSAKSIESIKNEIEKEAEQNS